MKKLGAVLILCCCTLSFSACAVREAGPCYGVGCPALASSKAPATTQTGQAQETTASTAAPAADQKKHHHKFSLRHPF